MSDHKSQSEQILAVEEPRSSVESKPQAFDVAQLKAASAEHDESRKDETKDETTTELSTNVVNGAESNDTIDGVVSQVLARHEIQLHGHRFFLASLLVTRCHHLRFA